MHRGKKLAGMCNNIDTSPPNSKQKITPIDITLKKKKETLSVKRNRNTYIALEGSTNKKFSDTTNLPKPYLKKYFENDCISKRPFSLTTPLFRKFNEHETSDSNFIDKAITHFSQENDDILKEQKIDLLCYEKLEDENISQNCSNLDDESNDYDSDDSVKDKDYVPEDDSSESGEECYIEKKNQIKVRAEVHTSTLETRRAALNISVQNEDQRVLSLKLLCIGVINRNEYQTINKRSSKDYLQNEAGTLDLQNETVTLNLQNEAVALEINNENEDIEDDSEVVCVIVIQEECEGNVTETDPEKDIEPEEFIQERRADEEIFVIQEECEGNVTETDPEKDIEPEEFIQERRADEEISEANQENEEIQQNECRDENLKLYTKSGQLRKRKIYDTNLSERLLEKKTKYRKQFLVKEGCTCANKCTEKFSEDERKELNEIYWQMSWKTRRTFIRQSCYVVIPKRRITSSPKRHPKRKFFFKNANENKIDVCKPFFLSTLGYKPTNDTVLYNALKVENCEEIQDNRGKHMRTIQFDRNNLTQHIESFNPTISHYRREHAPLRRYLPSDINVKLMHEDFLEKHPDQQLSYDLYRKHLKSLNISFARLGNEECEICEAHRIHSETESHNIENIATDCQVCNDYSEHKSRAKKARTLYGKHKDNKDESHLYFSTDLEKIIMLPRLDTFKEVIFCQRLVAYNQTFAPLGKANNEKPFAVLWHEAIAGRKQNDIISAFKAFFNKYRDIKYFDLWLDNCSAQNKNWLLYFFLVHLINSDEISADKITLNYFEKGHTYMSCDHFHHQVELSMKKSGKLYDFQDFVHCVEKANSGKVAVKEMQLADFVNICDYTSNRRIQTSAPRVYMKNIVQVCFERKRYNMFYKSDFDSDYIEVCFLKDTYLKPKNGPVFEVMTPREAERGISETRKQAILTKLSKLMPSHKLTFWKRIPSNTHNEELD